jgi:prophage endopeptidase
VKTWTILCKGMQPRRHRTRTRKKRSEPMSRTEFIIVTAIILFVAFVLGWFAHWLIHRFTKVTGSDMDEVDRMAQSLHEAEEARDQAIIYMQQREAELTNQLQQTEAELRAAMDGLRDVREEAEELRAHIERMEGG